MKKNQKRYRVVDLFSGGGGFGLGFREAGYRILLAIENQRSPARTYKYNIPEAMVLVEDIREISGADILRVIEKRPEILIGSPPCEPFTAANPRRKDSPLDRLYKDPQGRLTLEFIRLVGDLQPLLWVMENVPAIMDDGLKEAITREFRRAGYPKVYFNILRAEDYCTPSRRVRVFVSNVIIRPKKCAKRITVREALEGLPSPNLHIPPNHEPQSISPRKMKKIARIKPGKAMIYYKGHGGRRLPNLVRLDADEIAPTVLGSSRFIHPFETRFLTVREQARLMGYPDYHVFIGGRDEQYNMVGESVPPPLSKAIAEHIKPLIEEMER